MKVKHNFRQHGLQMDHELAVDNFAGGGGASTGLEAALGRSVDIAINHDRLAIAMHEANHPHTKHYRSDVFKVDPLKVTGGRPVGMAWFSPDCKHFSKAKGGKPVDKKIRGLAWIVVKWAALTQFRIGILENVEEFKDWGPLKRGADGKMYPDPAKQGFTFRRWWRELERLGYHLEMRELRACDYGVPTIRKRLFIVMRRDGLPIVWPEATHGKGLKPYHTAAECIDWDIPCPSIFLSKEDAKKLRVRRPLKDATLRRIARGVMRYVVNNPKPFIVPVTHHGDLRVQPIDEPFRTVTAAKRGEFAIVTPTLISAAHGEVSPGGVKRWSDGTKNINAPMGTVAGSNDFALIAPTLVVNTTGHSGGKVDDPAPTVTTGGHHILVAPTLVTTGHGERKGQKPRGRDIKEPLGTVVANAQNHALVAAFLAQHNGGMTGHHATKPLSTITQNGAQQQIVAASLVKLKGTSRDGQPVDEPLHTVQAGGLHYAEVCAFLMKYYGTDQDPRLEEPLATVTTKDRFALALVMVDGVEYQIVDIGMRMLTPRELFRAQGFPDNYIINPFVTVKNKRGKSVHRRLTKTEQIRMCGNSVPPAMAEVLATANYYQRAKEALA